MEIRLTEFPHRHRWSRPSATWSGRWRKTRTSTWRSRSSPDLPAVYQDQAKVQQILNNLLSNAIKFTPEGGRIDVVRGARRATVNCC